MDYTRSGVPITEELIRKLADEAEAGYDLDEEGRRIYYSGEEFLASLDETPEEAALRISQEALRESDLPLTRRKALLDLAQERIGR